MLNCRYRGTAVLLLSLLAWQSHGQSAPPPAAIIGTWLLESIVDTLDDGSRSYWMGRQPTGAIIYSASGHMSVQFMRDPRPVLPGPPVAGADASRLAGADPFGSRGAADLRNVVTGYYAYFGRYEVSPTGDAIAHFVETSLRPDEVGVVYKRAIRIEGDQLFISLRAEVDGIPRQRVLTWRRAPLPGGVRN
jgi:Lipocalin-like domain